MQKMVRSTKGVDYGEHSIRFKDGEVWEHNVPHLGWGKAGGNLPQPWFCAHGSCIDAKRAELIARVSAHESHALAKTKAVIRRKVFAVSCFSKAKKGSSPQNVSPRKLNFRPERFFRLLNMLEARYFVQECRERAFPQRTREEAVSVLGNAEAAWAEDHEQMLADIKAVVADTTQRVNPVTLAQGDTAAMVRQRPAEARNEEELLDFGSCLIQLASRKNRHIIGVWPRVQPADMLETGYYNTVMGNNAPQIKQASCEAVNALIAQVLDRYRRRQRPFVPVSTRGIQFPVDYFATLLENHAARCFQRPETVPDLDWARLHLKAHNFKNRVCAHYITLALGFLEDSAFEAHPACRDGSEGAALFVYGCDSKRGLPTKGNLQKMTIDLAETLSTTLENKSSSPLYRRIRNATSALHALCQGRKMLRKICHGRKMPLRGNKMAAAANLRRRSAKLHAAAGA